MVTIPRGGETTFHGPGQLVAYPIIDLRQAGLGARAYVELLEDAMVQVAGRHGISVSNRPHGHMQRCCGVLQARHNNLAQCLGGSSGINICIS